MNHDIRAMLNGTDQIRRPKGIINDKGNPMSVGDLRNGVNIRNIAVGIAKRFQIDGAGIFLDGAFHLPEIMRIHKIGLHTVLWHRMSQEVIAAAIDGFLGHNMSAIGCQRLDGIGDSCCTGSHRQCRCATLQRSHALFQHFLRGIGQPPVYIACIGKAETVGSMLAVAENIGSRLVNGNRTGIRRRIRLLLPYMQLHGFKFVLAHDNSSFTSKKGSKSCPAGSCFWSFHFSVSTTIRRNAKHLGMNPCYNIIPIMSIVF